MFIFEELGHALRRGRTIYGEVAGYGATCDAYHMSRPLPSGHDPAEAMGWPCKTPLSDPRKWIM